MPDGVRAHGQPRRFGVWLLLGLCAALASACSVELQRDLSERAANEAVVVLQAEGVAASRRASAARTWNVLVPASQEARGLAVLTEYGLPRRETDVASLLEAAGGLVPSDDIERARRSAVIEAGLAQTYLAMRGVHDAYVHAVLPRGRDGLARGAVEPPRVAVVLVVRAEGDGPPDDAVQAIAMGAVEGLSAGDVAVVRSVVRLPELAEATLVQVGPLAVSSASASTLRLVLGGMSAALLMVSGILLVTVVRRRR